MILAEIFAVLALIILLLRIGLQGASEAVARKLSGKGKGPSGGPYSGEAQDFFEQNPGESCYTDSAGSSWDNTFSDA